MYIDILSQLILNTRSKMFWPFIQQILILKFSLKVVSGYCETQLQVGEKD